MLIETVVADKSLARLREAYERASPDGPAHWPTLLARDRALWLQPVIIEKEKLATVTHPTRPPSEVPRRPCASGDSGLGVKAG